MIEVLSRSEPSIKTSFSGKTDFKREEKTVLAVEAKKKSAGGILLPDYFFRSFAQI